MFISLLFQAIIGIGPYTIKPNEFLLREFDPGRFTGNRVLAFNGKRSHVLNSVPGDIMTLTWQLAGKVRASEIVMITDTHASLNLRQDPRLGKESQNTSRHPLGHRGLPLDNDVLPKKPERRCHDRSIDDITPIVQTTCQPY